MREVRTGEDSHPQGDRGLPYSRRDYAQDEHINGHRALLLGSAPSVALFLTPKKMIADNLQKTLAERIGRAKSRGFTLEYQNERE